MLGQLLLLRNEKANLLSEQIKNAVHLFLIPFKILYAAI
jgi:hypothetical protein